MTRLLNIRHQYVEYTPEHLEPGVLYISSRFKTASHLCCCGCGLKVVTPLNPAKWNLIDYGSSVTLTPSIGNWSFKCRSHYRIIRNNVRWTAQFNERQIANTKRRDQKAVELYASPKSLFETLAKLFKR